MRIYQNIKFKTRPTMLASWPGMGNVGIISTDYLRSKLKHQILAEIDMTPFFIPESIMVENGIAELPELPRSIVYYHEDPDLLIFESNAQVGGKEGIAVIKNLVRLAAEHNVKRIFTAAAFAQNISHSAPSQILGAYNNRDMLREFTEHGVAPMPSGHIAGLNGLILGIAGNYDIEAGCFLGTIPSFATNLSYPKASLSILQLFEEVLGVTVDTTELEESIHLVDEQYSEIESRIRKYYPDAVGGSQEEEDDPKEEWQTLNDIDAVDDEEVPRYIMDKIEKMFEEVHKDKEKAQALKKELDRWDLYELYEHRFLDLFKEDDL